MVRSSLPSQTRRKALFGKSSSPRRGGRAVKPSVDQLEGLILLSNTATVFFQAAPIELQKTDFSETVNLPKFDPSLGLLQSVTLTDEVTHENQIKFENLSPTPTDDVNIRVSSTVKLSAPASSLGVPIPGFPNPLTSVTFTNQNEPTLLAGYDGVADYAGASGYTGALKTLTQTGTAVLNAANYDLSPYIYDAANPSISHTEVTLTGVRVTGGNGNLRWAVSTRVGAQVSVLYTYIPYASLSGNVYADTNDDGQFDKPVETGIGAVTVNLTGKDILNNDVDITRTTNPDGSYSFPNLVPGTYTVTETQPAGYLDGKDTAGTPGGGIAGNDAISGITLAGGDNSINNNFGELLPASLSGYVYYDANNNGVKDGGELPIQGTTINLYAADGTTVLATTQTDVNGFYSFTNLTPGSYVIKETQPSNYLDGKDTIGSQGGVTGNDVLTVTSLAAGADGVNNNFGELLPASLSGYVYYDADNNGVKDGGEAPIQGTTVKLYAADGTTVLATTLTDVNGFYSFPNLVPGSYVIKETQPGGYLDGKDAIGSQGGVTGDDVLTVTTLAAGGDGVNNNFGELLPASLSGYVYYDANNNGVRDGIELPIAGTTVKLYAADGTTVLATTTTNANGFYKFPGLAPGSYVIKETQPAGHLDGKDAIGSQGGVTGDDILTVTTLAAGVDGVENNFGELKAASLSGYVYYDAENDGSRAGNVGIGSVTVTLTGTNGQGAITPIVTQTDANGFYSFTNLIPGNYTITESQPSAYLDGKDTIGTPGGATGNDVFSNISLAAGVDGVENNFGELLPAGLSGFVYFDANNNGVKENGEQPISGATVKLYAADGTTVLATTTTNASGFYSFTGLAPGSYVIKETQPAGYTDGKDTIGTQGGVPGNDVFTVANLAAGVDGINNNFGELKPSSLSGFVYSDANNNGVKDSGEAPISGVTVKLYAADGTTVLATTTTNTEGFYTFPGLLPGSYVIKETQPSNYLDGKDTIGTQGGSAGNDVFTVTNLAAGVDGINNNFGELLPASLSGFVYFDANNNGVKENGEAAISGVIVKLYAADGTTVLATATTNGDGYYSFPGLAPGSYVIRETQPAGYTDGKDAIGSQGGQTGNDVFTVANLAAGVDGVNNNFGELKPSSLSGYVYHDADNDGKKDGGEAPIAGATVKLYAADGTTVLATTTTNTEGFYTFPGLLPGSYVIRETQPSGYIDGKDAIGTQGGQAGNDVFTVTNLAAGVDGVNNNFGELKVASLSGYVYYDVNNNGVKDSGEAAIQGTTVKLYAADGTTVLATTQTDANGFYSFTNLTPGSYVIKETQPAGYIDGKDAIGSQGGVAGDDVLTVTTLGSGVNGVNNNFGELKSASISGSAWFDCDANGVYGSKEAGKANVTIYLDANNNGRFDGGEVSTTTDSDGNYSFTGLTPGQYTVRQVVPLSFRQSTNDPGKITLAGGGKVSNVNFGLTATTAGISNFTVLVNGSTTYSDLRDNTDAGDLVQITFTVAPGVTDLPVNLVTYTAPDANFVGSRAYMQKVYDVEGGLFSTGTYTLTVVNPNSYFQVDFIVGCVIETLGGGSGCDYDSDAFYGPQGRLVSADNGDSKADAPLARPGVIVGNVFNDLDCDGRLDANEKGVGPVKVYLDANNNGRLDSGEYFTYTHPDGSYKFGNLDPGTYRVRMITPDGRTQTSSDPSSVRVSAGTTASGGNFGLKFVSGNTVGLRTTESIDWWNGATGQSLIKAFGGSSSSTGLGNWLAATFPKLYGSASSYNLAGKSNAVVASRFQTLYNASDKLDAKVMSLALSVYATTSNLGGVTGMFYGFEVTAGGLGSSTYSVGNCNAAFGGASSNSARSVLAMLGDVNSSVSNGKLYNGSSSLRSQAGNILDQVIAAGDSDRA